MRKARRKPSHFIGSVPQIERVHPSPETTSKQALNVKMTKKKVTVKAVTHDHDKGSLTSMRYQSIRDEGPKRNGSISIVRFFRFLYDSSGTGYVRG